MQQPRGPPRPSLAEPFIDMVADSPTVQDSHRQSQLASSSAAIDLVMVFSLRSGGEVKHPERFTQAKFVKRMLGLCRGKKPVVNELKSVFRTDKCFLDDSGRPFDLSPPLGQDAPIPPTNAAMIAIHLDDDDDDNALAQSELERKMACLQAEYVAYVGSANDTTETKFCELVVRSMAKRLQLTCGLTVRMFKSKRGDEIIMTVKADEGDLKVEAERTEYRLQTSNKPFDAIHTSKLEAVARDVGDVVMAESKAHLNNIQRHSTTSQIAPEPEMDPLLISHGKVHHMKLHTALEKWGHNELADGRTTPPVPTVAPSLWQRFLSGLIYISSDPWTYFALYTPYKSDPKLQPYYRRYLTSSATWTLFRPVDRIRLTNSIINRHLNLDALKATTSLQDAFALHDTAALDALKTSWALNKAMTSQPIGAIRDYFGEKIALYFVWLELYTKMLVMPAVFGIAIYVLDVFTTAHSRTLKIAFAVAIVVWSTLFTELWKRKSAIYNVAWGTDEFNIKSVPRTQFRGVRRLNPVDNTHQMWVQSTVRARWRIRASFLVVFVMVLIVLVALTGLFYLKHLSANMDSPKWKAWAAVGVSALNSVQITVLNMVYRWVANVLNAWENHRTDVEFENNLITKVFLFQFCNSFASFFYIAYVKHYVGDPCIDNNCLGELRLQLFILFGMQVVVGNLVEVVLPTATRMLHLYRNASDDPSKPKKSAGDTKRKLQMAQEHCSQEELQAMLLPYEASEAFQDYNEMVIQYGFVTLFVVAFPLTPVMALANNILEIHVDAFKLCTAHRRPFPHRASDIGSWYGLLHMYSYQYGGHTRH
ncbi:hypothetical protein, variant [Aphanomyces astaci]|uniref:Anoctamin transmembrane domain-containing protein n=1 Tax=Aphanomyces astaci TaxID=112090 RepID=W4GYX0_APHAT|nr:hypothetical protein, variant [Aphanomyces astaci]ETV84103.1 hypothetical protein, variant [Aphanomyces astaci]|eukprot:XP_009825795.1 hypothetical protein, variant [Aphanomyces astaci]